VVKNFCGHDKRYCGNFTLKTYGGSDFLGEVFPWQLYFYYPREKTAEAFYLVNRLSGLKELEPGALRSFCRQGDCGEIYPQYRGLKEIEKNFVLAAGTDGGLCGICAFAVERADVVQIDIVLIAREWRGKGVGRHLLGMLERACPPGTVLYVDQVTETGRKFFLRCGFTRDVNLFKVAG